jgi:hypothetical protein
MVHGPTADSIRLGYVASGRPKNIIAIPGGGRELRSFILQRSWPTKRCSSTWRNALEALIHRAYSLALFFRRSFTWRSRRPPQHGHKHIAPRRFPLGHDAVQIVLRSRKFVAPYHQSSVIAPSSSIAVACEVKSSLPIIIITPALRRVRPPLPPVKHRRPSPAKPETKFPR